MPSFDALAGAALTPGGVQNGLNDLISALVQAPIERRRLDMQQAAQQAQQDQAQQDFGLRQSDLMGRQQNEVYKQDQDAGQFDATQKFQREAEQRRSQEAVLQFLGQQSVAGTRAGANGFTMEDATRLSPATTMVPNPSQDPAAQFLTPQLKQNVSPQDRAKYAQDLLAAAGGGGQGITPVGHLLPGGTVDPQAQAVIDQLLKGGGMGAGIPQPGQGVPVQGAPVQPAQAPQQAAPPAQAPGKQITTAKLQALLADPKYNGYTIEELKAFYQQNGYQITP